MNTNTPFKDKLNKLIEYKNGTISAFIGDFNKKHDITDNTIKGWLYKNSTPDTKYASKLCSYFNCDFEYLFGDQKEIRRVDTTISMRLGLSQETILNIEKLTVEEKKIIELMFNPTGILQTRELLSTLFASSMYLHTDANRICICISALPSTNNKIVNYIKNYLNKSTTKEILKLQTKDAWDKLFDEISQNDYFKDSARKYLHNEIMMENKNAKEFLRINDNSELPQLPSIE